MKAEVFHRNQIEVFGIQICQLIFLLYGTAVQEKKINIVTEMRSLKFVVLLLNILC